MRVALWWEHRSDSQEDNLNSVSITALHLHSDLALNTVLLLSPVDKRKLTGYYLLLLQECDNLGQVSWTAVSSCYLLF